MPGTFSGDRKPQNQHTPPSRHLPTALSNSSIVGARPQFKFSPRGENCPDFGPPAKIQPKDSVPTSSPTPTTSNRPIPTKRQTFFKLSATLDHSRNAILAVIVISSSSQLLLASSSILLRKSDGGTKYQPRLLKYFLIAGSSPRFTWPATRA